MRARVLERGTDFVRACGVLLVCVLAAGLVNVAPAFAEQPFWQITQNVAPTNIAPGGEGELAVTVTNLGDSAAQGGSDPIAIADVLPNGLRATSIEGATEGFWGSPRCSLSSLRCTLSNAVPPYGFIEMMIHVAAENGAVTGLNEIVVSGGEAPALFAHDPVDVGGTPAGFGVESVQLQPFNEDGTLDTQAGSHPFELTTTIGLNQTLPLENQLNRWVWQRTCILPCLRDWSATPKSFLGAPKHSSRRPTDSIVLPTYAPIALLWA